ncbi:MAG: hypothetical protein Kow0062_12680 [Acidobacteriota bacterium]
MTDTRPPDDRREPTQRTGRIVAALVALVSAAIPLAFRWPPMWDASHHVATPWVIGRLLAGDPFFAQHFEVQFAPLPYWLTTVSVGALMPLVGPYVAFAVVCAAYAVALPWAFARLQRAFGVENPVLLPAAALLVFCQPFWAGLTNFVFGLPLFMLALAAWARLEPGRPWRLLAFAGWCVALYLAHIYLVAALFGLLVLWAGLAIVPRSAAPPPVRLGRGPRLAGLAIVAGLFVLGAYMVLIHPGADANSGPLVWALTPLRIPALVARAFGSPTLGHPWYLLAVAPLGLAAAAEWFRRGRAAFDGPRAFLLAGAAALAVLAVLGPANMEDGLGHTVEDIAQRFELPAVLLGLAALPRIERRGLRVLVLAGALAYAPVKLADVVGWYRIQDRQMTSFVERIAPAVREHASVLTITAPDAARLDWRRRLMNYAGNYLIIERHAYVPALFAARGQQPLSHRRTGEHRLILDATIAPDEWALYDYVLVQTDVDEPDVPGLGARTGLRASTEQFRLYEIER